MRSSLMRKLAVGMGVALVLAGGVALAAQRSQGSPAAGVAAGSFVSSSARSFHGPIRSGFDRAPGAFGDDFEAAASYLGLTAAELRTQLESGKTLAQIASTTSGKSTAGLVDALVAAEQKELDAAVAAGRLTKAQADAIAPSLKQRLTDLVNGVRGPGLHGHGPGHGAFGDDFGAAATYLGLTTAQLRTQLESGKTLAQIAAATSGKSAAGLVSALVAAEQKELDAAVAAGRLTKAQADAIVPTLKQRFTDLVNGVRPSHGLRRWHGANA
jgi:hypothetical protein